MRPTDSELINSCRSKILILASSTEMALVALLAFSRKAYSTTNSSFFSSARQAYSQSFLAFIIAHSSSKI